MARAGIGTDLEGFHAISAAVAAGRVTVLYVEQGRLGRPEIAAVVDDARASGARIEVVDDVRDRAVTGAPQGLVAIARPLPTVSIKDLVAAVDVPALLVLDHVEDPRNIGAAARSALASGMSGLVVAHNRAAPLGATAFKAAVGALETLPIAVVSSIPDALKRLGQLGVWCVGLDGDAEQSLLGLDLLALPVGVCVGAEGRGLSQLAAQRCDVVARIPMVGETESLNASIASALACYEVARVRGWVS